MSRGRALPETRRARRAGAAGRPWLLAALLGLLPALLGLLAALLATGCAARRAASPGADATDVPVLLYHHIADPPSGATQDDRIMAVTPRAFAAHVEYLSRRGYHAVTLHDIGEALRGRLTLPARPVAITFDDGFADAAREALPVLLRHGMRATFFVHVAGIGTPGRMTADDLRQLAAAGMEIGAHSVSHPSLPTLPPAELDHEIRDARSRLEALLGAPVTSFAYPNGAFDARVIAAVRAAGFTTAVTTGRTASPADRAFALPRHVIDLADGDAAPRTVAGL